MSEFEPLKFHSDYEIEKEFPNRIRRIGKTKFLSENEDGGGYFYVKINRKPVHKHRLLALQWIENDDRETKTQVDHINRIRDDNRLQNLRWVTPSENRKNSAPQIRRSNQYLEELPELTIEIGEYNGYEFDGYYYDYEHNRIIKENGSSRIKIIQPYINGKVLVIQLTDIKRKRHKFHYNKFIRTIQHILQEQEYELLSDDD